MDGLTEEAVEAGGALEAAAAAADLPIWSIEAFLIADATLVGTGDRILDLLVI